MLSESYTNLKERFGDLHSDVANVEMILGEYFENRNDYGKATGFYQKAADCYAYNGNEEKRKEALSRLEVVRKDCE